MVRRVLFSFFVSLITLPSFVVAQPIASDLTAEQVKQLTSGRTWAVAFQKENLANPHLTAYWTFEADGKLCARLFGSKAGTKCADEGKWRFEGDQVCWKLQWMGESGQYNYKSACGRPRKIGDKTYEFIDVSKDLIWLVFQPQ